MDAKREPTIKSMILSTFFVGCLWICSYTFLMPLFVSLIISSSLRGRFFSLVFTSFIVKKFPRLNYLREALFQKIEQHRPMKNNSNPPRILEIGVGSGENFSYYPEKCSATLLDFNPNFEPHIREKLQSFPKVDVERIVIAPAEDMTDVEDSSYDIVVSTHLLCSVVDVSMVMREVRRVLKPGGIYAFLDHVAYSDNSFVFGLQKWFSPMCRVYANGCCPDRDIINMVKQCFPHVNFQMLYPQDMFLLFRPHVIGFATKGVGRNG